MTLELIGEWPDQAERDLVTGALSKLVERTDAWQIAIATGDEPILTQDPGHPYEFNPGQHLQVMKHRSTKLRPRYVMYKVGLDFGFTALDLIQAVVMVHIFDDLGLDGLLELVKPYMPPSTLSA